MSELKRQLEALRREHTGRRYPGDLASVLAPEPQPARPAARVALAVASALTVAASLLLAVWWGSGTGRVDEPSALANAETGEEAGGAADATVGEPAGGQPSQAASVAVDSGDATNAGASPAGDSAGSRRRIANASRRQAEDGIVGWPRQLPVRYRPATPIRQSPVRGSTASRVEPWLWPRSAAGTRSPASAVLASPKPSASPAAAQLATGQPTPQPVAAAAPPALASAAAKRRPPAAFHPRLKRLATSLSLSKIATRSESPFRS
ncbi:MAG: hypothetical protein AAGB00_08630 [Planctomycetota bacterium]